MTHKNVLLPLILASLLFTAVNTALASPAEEMAALEQKAVRQEAAGFFGGAILGGLIAGPPGALVASVFGLLTTNSKNDHDQKELLASHLTQSQQDLIALQNQQHGLEARYLATVQEMQSTNLQRVSLNNQLTNMQNSLACCSDSALTLHFKTNSANIELHYMTALEELAKVAGAFDNPLIVISGFADTRGARMSNQKLSEQRVDAVAGALLALGISSDNIQSIAYGDTRPLSQSNSPEVYFFDRRVNVELHSRTNELFTLSE